MADATYAIPNFLGGEISQFAQGRFDKPDYRTSLNVCFNALPVEIGAWCRRPGTCHGGTTRGGKPGRVIRFDFEQANAVTLEFSDGWLRFRAGTSLVVSNDAQVILNITMATPSLLEVAGPVTWATGATLVFAGGAAAPLHDRQLLATRLDATHFTLADAVTGLPINGTTLGPVTSGVVSRVQELATPYTAGAWANIRTVQAETTDILLSSAVAPQALTVTPPSPGTQPVFALAPALFNDGPYLDPFTNGVEATPSAKSGIINLTLAFPAYSATTAYAQGAFVTSAGANYVSLADQNVNNTPAGSPAFWAQTSASAAINDGRGFLGSDVGRLVRLFSEPALWLVGSTYAIGAVVSYNPSGEDGAATYWQSLTASNIGHAPGSDLTNWQIVPQGAAIWTWGRITGLSNIIDRALSGSASFGDMVLGGGTAAAFNGAFSQPLGSGAFVETHGTGSFGPFTEFTLKSFVGKNYFGATPQAIQQAVAYPSSDFGFAEGNSSSGSMTILSVTLNLYGSATLPGSSSAGTLLGTSGVLTDINAASPIVSSDQATAWTYVWVEQVTVARPGGSILVTNYSLVNAVAQLSFFNPTGVGTGSGVSVEILGAPLLYTNPIVTWRLGLYSNTTGWPTCGTYDDGRLYLGGVIKNRFDASMSNGIDGATVNFAPTGQYGAVAANNAISYKLEARDANQIVGMVAEEGGIVMFTQAGEWLIRAPTTGPIAPNNISGRRITKVGAANIEPLRTEHTNIFVHRYRRKLTEYFPDAYSGKFTGPNLADKAEHLVSSGIAEIAYTSAVTPVIWGRCDDGSLFGVTYKRDTLSTAQPPTFYGWHRHALGSGRIVESLCSGPSVGGDLDALTMVTNDAATGIRHVEVLTDTPDENAALADSWYLDNAVTPSSTVSTLTPSAGAPYGGLTLNGLWHLNGKTAQVFAGGLDCGDRGTGSTGFTDFVVANGSCFVPYGDGISAGSGCGLFTPDFAATAAIVVGFTYNSDGQLVRPIAPADTGARNGPALGKTSRVHQYSMLLSNSRGVSVGADFDRMRPVPLTLANGSPIPVLGTFAGVVHDSIECDYSYDSMIAWRASRPNAPANLVAISGNIQTQDR